MRRPVDVEHRVRHRVPEAGGRFLELGLVVDVRRARVLDAPGEGGHDRILDPLEAALEEERSEGRLEQSGQHVLVFREAIQLFLGHVERLLGHLRSEAELPRDHRATCSRDDMRPNLRQLTFRVVREALVELAGDRELEDAVAQELEPFVRRPTVGRPRRVREDVLQPLRRERLDQALEGSPTGAR